MRKLLVTKKDFDILNQMFTIKEGEGVVVLNGERNPFIIPKRFIDAKQDLIFMIDVGFDAAWQALELWMAREDFDKMMSLLEVVEEEPDGYLRKVFKFPVEHTPKRLLGLEGLENGFKLTCFVEKREDIKDPKIHLNGGSKENYEITV